MELESRTSEKRGTGEPAEHGHRSTKELMFLDDLQRLGLGYHFEEQIEEVLHQVNKKSFQYNGDDLFSISPRFRLLRRGGFHAPSGK